MNRHFERDQRRGRHHGRQGDHRPRKPLKRVSTVYLLNCHLCFTIMSIKSFAFKKPALLYVPLSSFPCLTGHDRELLTVTTLLPLRISLSIISSVTSEWILNFYLKSILPGVEIDLQIVATVCLATAQYTLLLQIWPPIHVHVTKNGESYEQVTCV